MRSTQEPQALTIVSEPGINLPVTQADAEALGRQRALFHKFVQDQMTIEVDYGVVPGTKKQSLFKPGAEKLAQLFGLGTRVTLMEKLFSREENFALFTYKAEMYVLRNPAMVVAQCEGSCNSQEKKYRTRSVYQQGQQQGSEETPICDILNTLMKMAQKRAVVGAVILATAASDFFTHDVDDEDDAAANGIDPNPKAPPTTIKASIKATGATSRDQSQGAIPQCCGRGMMVSKYANKETGAFDWYCAVCKASKPREDASQAIAPTPPAPEPGAFSSFTGSLFAKQPPAETIETVQVEIAGLLGQLKVSHVKFFERVETIFKKPAETLSLEECKKVRDHYRIELQKEGIK